MEFYWQRQMGSTWRELYAIKFALMSFREFLKDKNLIWSTDNYGASCIVEKGSNKEHLQDLSESIFEICKKGGISFSIKWIPREFLSFADMLSKQPDYDDWETTPEFFDYISSIWGPFSIDRFADDSNHKLQRFNSKYYCVDTEGVDAFRFSWENENNFLVPPVYLVPRVLKHMECFRAKGVLVVPKWQSAAFYPLIINRDGTFRSFVKDMGRLHQTREKREVFYWVGKVQKSNNGGEIAVLMGAVVLCQSTSRMDSLFPVWKMVWPLGEV